MMSKKDTCIFCEKQAIARNKQGLAVCLGHKDKVLEERRCICGEFLEIKHSKWGPFFLCKHCGPKSINKVLDSDNGDFKLNKRFRKEKIYTIDELEKMWE